MKSDIFKSVTSDAEQRPKRDNVVRRNVEDLMLSWSEK